ncbi:hypothetical protein GPA27_13455 [Aromatoleum toluolicum]|uniref:Uncharacterized protein n=1 Tax=Aromatoleum toluolicum TaxID=90060 RepID=A0ABX1NGI7_9RHOO|nr:hypothetical protein [Aromatoleum toluolicum]NMF98392.1 hypothetical protein [Aromatoleum toluolicum]
MEMFNCINVKRVISPASVADNTAQVGQIIDHQNVSAATYIIATGSLGDAGAEFTTLLEESDASDMSGATAVADADLLGTEALASFIQSDDDKCFKLGYKGTKRYTRLTITPANNATASLLAAVCVICPNLQPTANPPA